MRRQPRLNAARDLFALEMRDHRKQLESYDRAGTFYAFVVDETSAEHLKPAADAEDRRLVGAVLANCDIEAALAEPGEVSHRRLRARYDDEIRISECGRIADPPHANARLRGQWLELVEVGDTRQSHDGDIDERLLIRLSSALVPVDGVFGRQAREIDERQHAERGNAGLFEQRDEPGIEQ